MPSRDNTARVIVERALRVALFVVLVGALWWMTRPSEPPGVLVVRGAEVDRRLSSWIASAPPVLHIDADSYLTVAQRYALRSLRRAGTALTWQHDSLPALAVEIAPLPAPNGGAQLWMAASSGERLTIEDAIAPFDSVTVADGGVSMRVPLVSGTVTSRARGAAATASLRDTVAPRRVLVLGRASWETKFVIAALEEAGWPVDARVSLAPDLVVTQGRITDPDTATHAAVVVLDAPSPRVAAAVVRYVRSGGGLVLSGASGSAASFSAIAAGRVGARVRPASSSFASDAPRDALSYLTIAPHPDAIPLEMRGARTTAAARRIELGRVAQIGYDESWRWRLSGSADAPVRHRRWWSNLVASVAYRAALPLQTGHADDSAPLAHHVATLGMPRDAPSTADASRWVPPPGLLFGLIMGLLLLEIASRRLRGAA